MNYLHPDADNLRTRSRFHLSVVAIFRNESHILREWIEHYLAMGIDHFYLINNNSSDDYRHLLNDYQRAGKIDLFHCEKDNYQVGAYTELLPTLQKESTWVAAFDLDEFIYAPSGHPIACVLQQFQSREAVLVPWLSFGSSGHLSQPASVVDNFVHRGSADVSRAFLKAIARPPAIVEFHQHNPVTMLGNKVLSNGSAFGNESFVYLDENTIGNYLLINNHYRLQSRDFFLKVKTRRPEVHESVVGISKELNFFELNDQYWNCVTDTRLRTLHSLKRSQAG